MEIQQVVKMRPGEQSNIRLKASAGLVEIRIFYHTQPPLSTPANVLDPCRDGMRATSLDPMFWGLDERMSDENGHDHGGGDQANSHFGLCFPVVTGDDLSVSVTSEEVDFCDPRSLTVDHADSTSGSGLGAPHHPSGNIGREEGDRPPGDTMPATYSMAPLEQQHDFRTDALEKDINTPPNSENRSSNSQQAQATLRGRKQSSTGGPSKPLVCSTCPRSFRRPEHLKRHNRSLHTKEKPYKCMKCGRGFSRRDHLSQHVRTRGHGTFALRPLLPAPSRRV